MLPVCNLRNHNKDIEDKIIDEPFHLYLIIINGQD